MFDSLFASYYLNRRLTDASDRLQFTDKQSHFSVAERDRSPEASAHRIGTRAISSMQRSSVEEE
jgi:hypothetical protein